MLVKGAPGAHFSEIWVKLQICSYNEIHVYLRNADISVKAYTSSKLIDEVYQHKYRAQELDRFRIRGKVR